MNWRIVILLILTSILAGSEKSYVFGWTQLDNPELHVPRGGTSSGPTVDLDKTPSPYWQALQNKNLTKFEQDRLAILAMQGQFKVNFDFMETMGFIEGYVPEKPYQSWGTEFVVAIEEEKNFISLQHIMVMYFNMPDGSISEPMVVKHWRQDWKYQDKVVNDYVGQDTWVQKKIPWNKRRGTWSQIVYQVDDSPRYESYGEWKHSNNSSAWLSKETSRPLPRREASVRNDYDILVGTNIHTITPNGWVHEQNNNKKKLDGTILAKEIGLARYQRIQNFDWNAGEQYWEATNPFWQEVRKFWTNKLTKSKNITVKPSINNSPLYGKLFGLADAYGRGNTKALGLIEETIEGHIIEN